MIHRETASLIIQYPWRAGWFEAVPGGAVVLRVERGTRAVEGRAGAGVRACWVRNDLLLFCVGLFLLVLFMSADITN